MRKSLQRLTTPVGDGKLNIGSRSNANEFLMTMITSSSLSKSTSHHREWDASKSRYQNFTFQGRARTMGGGPSNFDPRHLLQKTHHPPFCSRP